MPRASVYVGIALVVAAEYRPLVLRTSLISCVLNADSGRYADTLISYYYYYYTRLTALLHLDYTGKPVPER